MLPGCDQSQRQLSPLDHEPALRGPSTPAQVKLLTMRLINVETLQLESFLGNSIPSYAILSHTWGRDGDELSFADLQSGNFSKAGLTIKVSGCLRQAQHDGLSYVWIDTCCIDKTNSVELNEAINSMFRWYEEARVCYAYLAECESPSGLRDKSADLPITSWFRRGWTLQELLAPKQLRFYCRDWRPMGDRRDIGPDISKMTGIPFPFLAKYRPLREASVAQRMSWASRRVTKREEDAAYCLLGIFGITMSMNYGERQTRAFERLQRMIMEEIDDDSILAWGLHTTDAEPGDPLNSIESAGALAKSPSNFVGCGHIAAFTRDKSSERPLFTPGYIQANLKLWERDGDPEIYGILKCGFNNIKRSWIGIPLHREQRDRYIRLQGRRATEFSALELPQEAEVVKISTIRGHPTNEEATRVFIDMSHSKVDLRLVEVHPKEYWDGTDPSIVVRDASPRDGPEKRHLVVMRLRPQDAGVDDMIVMLHLRTGSTTHYASPTVMTTLGLEPLVDFSQCFAYLRSEVRERTECKVAGWLVSAIVEPLQDTFQMYLVRLVTEKKHPDHLNVDATLELRHAYRKMGEELKRLERENSRLRKTVEKLEKNIGSWAGLHSRVPYIDDHEPYMDEYEEMRKRLDSLRS